MLMLMVKKQVAPLSTRRSSTLLQQQSKHNGHQPTKLQIPAAMYSSPSAKKPSAYKAAPRTFVTSAPQCPRCDKVGGGMMGWSYRAGDEGVLNMVVAILISVCCPQSVYAAEQVLGPGGRVSRHYCNKQRGRTESDAILQEYHKPCLTCIACKRTVQPGSFQEHEGDVSGDTRWRSSIHSHTDSTPTHAAILQALLCKASWPQRWVACLLTRFGSGVMDTF